MSKNRCISSVSLSLENKAYVEQKNIVLSKLVNGVLDAARATEVTTVEVENNDGQRVQ